jgi:hypothetical protein
MKNNGQDSGEIAKMANLVSVLANANDRRASAWHKESVSVNAPRNSHLQVRIRGGLAGAVGRTARTVGRRGLILASLVLATVIVLQSAAFAAPVGAAGAVGASPALQPSGGPDPLVTFNFNIGGYIGSGSLMTNNVGGGIFVATGGTLTMASTSRGGIAGNTYCLVPTADPPGSVTTSHMGAFIYDDLITPGANPAFPDIYALLFSNRADECGDGFSGADEINIWATDLTSGGNARAPGNYSFYDAGANAQTYFTPTGSSDSFTAAVVTTTYSYSGRGFNKFECLTGGTPDCSNPGTGNPYRSSNSVTATLQLAAPLCAPATAAASSCPTAPINVLCGQNASQNFVSMTLNDGVNTVSVNSTCSQSATAWVSTDINGNINAWYLDATGGSNEDIHTLYDPGNVIAGPSGCSGCYGNKGNEQDYGQYSLPTSSQYAPLLVYGYNLGSHGSFTPGYNGGTTTVDNCRAGQICSLVPGNTFTIEGPNAGAIPAGAVLTEQLCVVPADPRGPNCGATGGRPARSLNVSDLPQCKGFGNEVIPDYLCGASGKALDGSGNAGTGFALILGNAEQIDTFNGTYGDSELDVEKVPGLARVAGDPATNPTCPKGLQGTLPILPSALGAVGTRSGSLVEEQTPEQTLDGRPLLIEMTSSCEPPRTNHGPGLTLEGMGFKLRTEDSAVIGGTTRNQRLLAFANYKYLNLDAVMLFTKFPTNTPTRKNLQNCINKSQTLLNSGPTHYACAAEQVYRCEQMVDTLGQMVDSQGNKQFVQFGPTTWPLRLPDPFGDVVRRLGNLYYTINTRINLQEPNADWPLTADPNPNSGCP